MSVVYHKVYEIRAGLEVGGAEVGYECGILLSI